MYLEAQNLIKAYKLIFPIEHSFSFRLWLFSPMDRVGYETYDTNEVYDNMDLNPTEIQVISVALSWNQLLKNNFIWIKYTFEKKVYTF